MTTPTKPLTDRRDTTAIKDRLSRCSCGDERPSDWGLPFFEYRGPDSRLAHEACAHCGFYEVAHVLPHLADRCPGFKPHGSYEYDNHYCGHGGWD